MKKIELLGLSAVTAALIMTGCSSDSDNKSSIPSAPAEATTPLEINTTTVQNVMALLQNGGGGPMSSQLAKIQAKVAALKASGNENSTDSYNCDISGTWTSTYTASWSDSPDGSWSSTYAYTDTYNNCIDNYSGTNDVGDELNMRVQSGTYSWVNTGEYNSDTNRSKDSWSGTSNIVTSYENNETSASKVYTSADSYSGSREADGDYVYASNVSYSSSSFISGEYKRVDTNTTGDTVYGYRYVYGNYKTSNEETMDYNIGEYVHSKLTADGHYTNYDTNSSGEYLDYSHYFKNFVMESTSDGANENNMSANGTIGDTCLGGSVTLSTAPVIQENQIDYLDGSEATGLNVLPYAGGASMTGSTTAAISFAADDTNHTSATVTIGETNTTYVRWSDLAVGDCSGL